jgi:hypothetical protein
MRRHCTAESLDRAATQKINDITSKKRKLQKGQQQTVNNVCHDKEITNAIKHSMKESKKYYTGHKILPTHTVKGQLCALYVINSSYVQKQFTNLQTFRFLNSAIDSPSRLTIHTMGKN